jgi:hypothetical protein
VTDDRRRDAIEEIIARNGPKPCWEPPVELRPERAAVEVEKPKARRRRVLTPLVLDPNARELVLPFSVEVDHPVVSLNRLSNEHYFIRARRRRKEQEAPLLALSPWRAPKVPLADGAWIVIRLVRLASRAADDDAVPGMFKSVRDALCEKWLGISDSPKALARARVRFEYGQEVRRVPMFYGRYSRVPYEKRRTWKSCFRIEIRNGGSDGGGT